jgi:hypothetical protein
MLQQAVGGRPQQAVGGKLQEAVLAAGNSRQRHMMEGVPAAEYSVGGKLPSPAWSNPLYPYSRW